MPVIKYLVHYKRSKVIMMSYKENVKHLVVDVNEVDTPVRIGGRLHRNEEVFIGEGIRVKELRP